MKASFITILLLSFGFKLEAQSSKYPPDKGTVQHATATDIENADYLKKTSKGKEVKSSSLMNKQDTMLYPNGKIYRTCIIANSKLEGDYKMYFPTGKLYFKAKYKANILVDTSYFYTETGSLDYITVYANGVSLHEEYFDESNKLKKKKIFEPSASTTNAEKTLYYNSAGNIISKEEYQKIYPKEN